VGPGLCGLLRIHLPRRSENTLARRDTHPVIVRPGTSRARFHIANARHLQPRAQGMDSGIGDAMDKAFG
jgi:hypothetical protein